MSSNKKTYDKDNENNDDIINIKEIKKNYEKYNLFNKVKKEFTLSKYNKSSPKICRKCNTLNSFSNIKENKDIEKENIKLKNKIAELEKEFKKQKTKYKNQILLLKENSKNKSHNISTYN